MTHTTSLELSKALYEKGLEINTEKWWCDFGKDGWELLLERYRPHPQMDRSCPLPAPSTDELLEVMPEGYLLYKNCLDGKTYGYGVAKLTGDYTLIFIHETFNKLSAAEALGLMAKHLLENGYHYSDKEKRIINVL